MHRGLGLLGAFCSSHVVVWRDMARGWLRTPRMAYRDNSGLTACYHVISMLEAQLRSAHDLRERLEAPVISAEHHAHILKGLCGTLLDEAVAAAQAVAMLREQVCGHGRNSTGFVSCPKTGHGPLTEPISIAIG